LQISFKAHAQIEFLCVKICGLTEPFRCLLPPSEDEEEELSEDSEASDKFLDISDRFYDICEDDENLYFNITAAKFEFLEAPEITFLALNKEATGL
jgi:hypothetical protein